MKFNNAHKMNYPVASHGVSIRVIHACPVAPVDGTGVICEICGLKTNSGFTLIELLITTAILGIIMIGLHQVMGTALSAYDSTKNKQDLLAQARYAMERMVMFVQETDSISEPHDVNQEILAVSERVLDTYDNDHHTYTPGGDGTLDADNDSMGGINDDDTNDPPEFITFDLDKTEAGNWKLQEKMPDYSTAVPVGHMAKKEICEHVTAFTCSALTTNLITNLIEIELTLNNGTCEVSLKTRVKARLIDL